MRIEFEKNNKIIVRIPYTQKLIRYIQELLGHKSSKTTEIYTHLSTKNLSAIKNPLGNILKENER